MGSKPIILITLGDPAGVGPEVIVKAIEVGELSELAIPVVVGPSEFLGRALGSTGVSMLVKRVDYPLTAVIPSKKAIFVLEGEPKRFPPIKWGQPTEATGRIAAGAIIGATEAVMRGEADALVTGPVSKEALNLAGYRYPGQTEMLAYLTHTKRFAMMLVGQGLRVALVTTHCPVSEVSNKIVKGTILEKLEVLHNDLRSRFGIPSPKIGVCALNPHGGEGGIFGREEIEQIAPAVQEARERGIEALGPFPADSLFPRREQMGLDAILAMYHDQGLIPLKLNSFGRGVNVTLGLPIVRASPDHGTAFDIAGRGIADPGSLIKAFKLAAEIAKGEKEQGNQVTG